jgi:hypothetical protein
MVMTNGGFGFWVLWTATSVAELLEY